MKLLIITNRKIIDSAATDETLFGDQVNDKGACELRLAWAEKGAHGKWKLKLIPEPTQMKLDDVPSQAAFQEYNQLLRAKKKDCVFYIHGFNKTFEESLSQSHRIHKRYGVGVVTFSWPSNPGGWITDEYREAKAIALNSIVALDRAFEKLGTYMCQESDEFCEISFNLLVHSLGNYMFEKFIRAPIFSRETRMFDNIVLNAADVNLESHEQWTDTLKYARRVYTTINEGDKILNLSEWVNPDRLGNTARNLISDRVDYFDLSDGKNVDGKHQHFEVTAAVNTVVETFFRNVLHGRQGLPLSGTSFDREKNAFILEA